MRLISGACLVTIDTPFELRGAGARCSAFRLGSGMVGSGSGWPGGVDDGSVSLQSGGAHRHTKVNGQCGLNRQSAVQRDQSVRRRRSRRESTVVMHGRRWARAGRSALTSIIILLSRPPRRLLRILLCFTFRIFAFCEMRKCEMELGGRVCKRRSKKCWSRRTSLPRARATSQLPQKSSRTHTEHGISEH